MEKRYLSDIKLESGRLVKFIHSEELFTCSCYTGLTEAVEYYEGTIRLHANNDGNSSENYKATEEDFQELKKVMLKSPEFVSCGKNYIFSLYNVVSFEKGSKDTILIVDCRNNCYNITLNNKEEAKHFLIAMQKKWQKTFTEWDQNRDSSIEEDALNRQRSKNEFTIFGRRI